MIEWASDNAWWLFAAGVVGLLCGLGIMVALALTMSADHFTSRPRRSYGNPVCHTLVRVVRNVLGALLLLSGIILAMPMVPGPGVLLIILGLSLTDIPGKHALGRRILRNPKVLKPLNALRSRCGRPPLQPPGDS